MYCSNCPCDFCQTQRATDFNVNKVDSDVIRLVKKAGPTGLTMRELKLWSRSFRGLSADAQALTLDQLTLRGVLITHHFPANRGQGRAAFLAVKLSQ
jgi:hypothetical protein